MDTEIKDVITFNGPSVAKRRFQQKFFPASRFSNIQERARAGCELPQVRTPPQPPLPRQWVSNADSAVPQVWNITWPVKLNHYFTLHNNV